MTQRAHGRTANLGVKHSLIFVVQRGLGVPALDGSLLVVERATTPREAAAIPATTGTKQHQGGISDRGQQGNSAPNIA
eukprot:1760626-Rhodomonas_salina.2